MLDPGPCWWLGSGSISGNFKQDPMVCNKPTVAGLVTGFSTVAYDDDNDDVTNCTPLLINITLPYLFVEMCFRP